MSWVGRAGSLTLVCSLPRFMSVIGRPDFPAAAGGGAAAAVLTEDDRKVICMIALAEPSLPQARFEAFIMDFAAMCR